jgi:ankyrin repeat protein
MLIAGTTTGAGSEVADAAQNGDRAAVQKLIQQKADVNAAQVDGATALHWACVPRGRPAAGHADSRRSAT